jgi:hypothetical protein
MLIRDLLGMEARVFSCISQFVSISLMAAKFSQDLGYCAGIGIRTSKLMGGSSHLESEQYDISSVTLSLEIFELSSPRASK